MNKLLRILLGVLVKKKTRVVSQDTAVRQAREQIKMLRSKGLRLPIMTF